MKKSFYLLLALASLAFAGTASAQSITISSNAGHNVGQFAAGTSGRLPIGARIDVSGAGFTGITGISAGDASIRFYDAANQFIASAAVSTAGWVLTNPTFTGTVDIPDMGNSAADAVKCTIRVISQGGGTAESTVGTAIPADPTKVTSMMSQPGNGARLPASATILISDDFPNDADVQNIVVEFQDSTTAWNAVAPANVSINGGGGFTPGAGATIVVDLAAEDTNNDGDITDAGEPASGVADGSIVMRVRITDTGNNVSTLGPRSGLFVDTIQPEVADINTIDTNIVGNIGSDGSNTSEIDVVFSEPIETSTATAARFAVSLGMTNFTVTNVAFSGGDTIATLTVTNAFAAGEKPSVTVASQVTDKAGNTMAAGNRNGSAADDEIEPTLQRAFLNTQDDTLTLVFDEQMANPGAYDEANFTLAQAAGPVGPTMAGISGGDISAMMTNVAGDTYEIDLDGSGYVLGEGNTIAPVATVQDVATAPNGANTTPAVTIVLLPTLNSVSYDPIAHNLTLTFSKAIRRTSLVNNMGNIEIRDVNGMNGVALSGAPDANFAPAGSNAAVTTLGDASVMEITLNAVLDELIHESGDANDYDIGSFRVFIGSNSMIVDTNGNDVLETPNGGIQESGALPADGAVLATVGNAQQMKDVAVEGNVVDVLFDDYVYSADVIPGNFSIGGANPSTAVRRNDGVTVRLTFTSPFDGAVVGTDGIDLDVNDGTAVADQFTLMAGVRDTTGGNAGLAVGPAAVNNQADDDSTKLNVAVPGYGSGIMNVAHGRGTAMDIAVLRFSDLGSGDGLPTILGGDIVLGQVEVFGTFDGTEHTFTLEGAGLTPISVAGVAGTGEITFTIPYAERITIADGASVDLTVSVLFHDAAATFNTTDGARFRLDILADDSDIISQGGSTFAAAALSMGSVFTYDIQATHVLPGMLWGNAATVAAAPYTVGQALQVTNNFADELVGTAFGGTLDFTYVDQNGLEDVDAATNVTLATAVAMTNGGLTTGFPASAAHGGDETAQAADPTVTTVARDLIVSGASAYTPPAAQNIVMGAVSGFTTTNAFDVLPDTDATLEINSAQANWDASALATPDNLVQFTVTDSASGDGLPTIVKTLDINIAIGNTSLTHANFTYSITGQAATIAQTAGDAYKITFTGDWSIADNTAETFDLNVQHNLTGQADLDEATWTVTVPTQPTGTLLTNGSVTHELQSSVIQNAAVAGAGSGVPVPAEVVSTVMRFTAEPTAGQDFTINSDLVPLTVEFVDANQNRDLGRDGPETVSVGDDSDGGAGDGMDSDARLGAGADTQGVSNGLVSLSVDTTAPGGGGSPGRLGVSFEVSTTVAAHAVITTANSFNLRAFDDADSTLTTNTASMVNLSSVSAVYTPVWTIDIDDMGTSDGKPTIVDVIQLTASNFLLNGSNDADDFDWQLTGPITTVVGITAGTTVTFSGIDAQTLGTDGGSPTVTLSVEVRCKATPNTPTAYDGMNFQLEINSVTTRAATSTSLDATVPPVSASLMHGNNPAVTVAVVATTLDSDAIADPQTAGVPFMFDVRWEDANGNRDLDADNGNATTLSIARSDTPAAGIGGGAPLLLGGTIANGVVTVTITLTETAVLAPATLSLNMTSGVSPAFGPVGTNAFSLNPLAEVTMAAGAGNQPNTVSSVGMADIFDVLLTDGGVDDIDARVDAITFTHDGLDNADSSDCDWELRDGGMVLQTIMGSTLGADSNLIFNNINGGAGLVIADGTAKTLVLRATPRAQMLNTQEAQRWVYSTTEASVTYLNTGSQSSGGPTTVSNQVSNVPGAAIGCALDVDATEIVPLAGDGTTALDLPGVMAGDFGDELPGGVNNGDPAGVWASNTIGGGMPIRFRYQDTNGNPDRDGGHTLRVLYNGAFAGIDANNGGDSDVNDSNGIVTISDLSFTNAGLAQNLAFDTVAGFFGAAPTITVPNFDVYDLTDNSSIFVENAAPTPVNVSALDEAGLATAPASFAEVWNVRVDEVIAAVDQFSTDLNTIELVAVSSTGLVATNEFDWVAVVNGFVYTGSVGGTVITFDFDDMGANAVSAASGVTPSTSASPRVGATTGINSSSTISFRLRPKTTLTNKDAVDGMMFTGMQLQNPTYVGGAAASTDIGNVPFAKSGGGNVTISVVAETINIATNEPVAASNWTAGYTDQRTITVEYVDGFGLRDLQRVDNVVVTRTDAGGMFWNDGGLNRVVSVNADGSAAVAGVATFSNLILSTPASTTATLQFTGSGAALTLGNTDVTPTFNVLKLDEITITQDATIAEPINIPSTAAGGFVDVFDFRVVDNNGDSYAGKTSDTIDASYTSITLNGTNSTANLSDGTWQLRDAASAPIATGVVMGNTVVFSGFSRTISDDGFERLKVAFNLATGVRQSADNQFWNFEADANTLAVPAANNTSGEGVFGVQAFGNIAFQVVSTQIAFDTMGFPPVSVREGQNIADHNIYYVDAQGNRDLDRTQLNGLTVTWSGVGAVNNGMIDVTNGQATVTGVSLDANPAGLLGGMLTWTDGVAGHAALMREFDLNEISDATSTIANGPLNLAMIDSDPGTMAANAVDVWSVDISDAGTSDRYPTVIDDVTITLNSAGGGANTHADFTYYLNGTLGTLVGNTLTFDNITTVTVADNSLDTTANGAGMITQTGAAVLNSPAGQELTLAILPNANVTDPDTFDHMMLTNITITAISANVGTNSSTVGNLPIVKPSAVEIDVVATKVEDTDNLLNGVIGNQVGGDAFAATVEYNDDNGNRDVDVVGDQVIVTREDGGVIAAGTNVSNAAVAGVAQFPGITLGYPGFEDSHLIWDDINGGTVSIAGNPQDSDIFDLNGKQDLATNGNPQTEVANLSSISLTESVVLDFEINDAGTDLMQIDVASITFNFDQPATTMNLSQGTFTLEAAGLPPLVYAGVVAENATSITFNFPRFGVGNPLTIADNASKEIVLKFEPHTAAGNPGVAGDKNLGAEMGVGQPTVDGSTMVVRMNPLVDVVTHFGLDMDAPGTPESATVKSGSIKPGAGLITEQHTATYQVETTALVVETQPMNGDADNDFATVGNPVAVKTVDAYGNIDLNYADNMTVRGLTRGGLPVLPAGPEFHMSTIIVNDGNADGVYQFTNLQLTTAGLYTLEIGPETLLSPAPIATAAFTIDHGAAENYAITGQPAASHTAGANTIATTLQLRDQWGNDVDSTVPASIAILNDPMTNGAATLNGSLNHIGNGTGTITFNNLNIQQAGVGFTMRVSSALPTPTVDTNAFDIVHAAPAGIEIVTQPNAAQEIVAGTTFSASIQVNDQYGNPTISTESSISVTAGAPNKLVNPAVNITNVMTTNGALSFPVLEIQEAGNYSLAFTSTSALPTTNGANTFEIVPAAPHHMVIPAGMQPAPGQDIVAGTAIPFQVQLQDIYNNDIDNQAGPINVSVSINKNSFSAASVLNVSATAPTGQATFGQLDIETAATGYIIQASAALPVANVNSNAFDIVAADPDHFVITQQPTNVSAHEAGDDSIEVVLQLRDEFGNDKAQAGVTATVAIDNDGSINDDASIIAPGSLVTPTDLNGVARFTAGNSNAIAIDKSGNNYTLAITGNDGANLAGAGGANPISTTQFDVTHTDASKWEIDTQPTSPHVAGANTITITVLLLDQYDNLVTAVLDQENATLDSLATNGLLNGTLTGRTVGGIFTFAGINVTDAGDSMADTYTIEVTGAGLTGVISDPFLVVPAATANLVVGTQPGNGNGGMPLMTQPTVNLFDQYGNATWNDSTTQITASIANNAGEDDTNAVVGNGVLSGTDVTANAGVATFTDLEIDKKGTGYTLNFAVVGNGAINIGPSNGFDILVGDVASLEMVTQPDGLKAGRLLTTQPEVRGRDLGGNIVTAMQVGIRARIGMNAGIGTISGIGTSANVQSTVDTQLGTGVATFTDLQIDALSANLPAFFTLEFFVPANLGITEVASAQFELILGSLLLETKLDDHDKNTVISERDEIYFYFDEPLAPASVPADNIAGALDTAMGIAGGVGFPTFGNGATSELADHPTNGAGSVVIIRVGSSSSINTGVTTVNPNGNGITDALGNPDVTQAPVLLADGTSDEFQPTVESLTINPAVARAGDTVVIEVVYSDVQTADPTFTLDNVDAGQTVLTAALIDAERRTFSYEWVALPHDGVNNFDGLYTFTFDGEANGVNPVAFPFDDTTATAKSFTVDTRTPVFSDARVFKMVAGVPTVDNAFKDTDVIRLEVDLQGEAGMATNASVSADLSAIGGMALETLTETVPGTFSIDLPINTGLVSTKLLTLTLMANDGANNMSAINVAVEIDNTAPQPVLSYNAPSDMVTEGELIVTAQFYEDLLLVPSIEVTGLAGIGAVQAMTQAGPRTFTATYLIPNGLVGTGTVIISGTTDLVGNTVQQPAPNQFEVVASAPALVANAGPDQVLTSLSQVTLSGAASVNATTFAWSVLDPNLVDATGLLSSTTTSTVTMMPLAAGTYTVELVVSNGTSTATDYVNVTVPNIAPVVTTVEEITVASTEVVVDEDNALLHRANFRLSASAFDANGDAIEQVRWVPGANNAGNISIKPSTADSMTAELTVGGAEMTGGVYTFDVLVYDSTAVLNNSPSRKTVTVKVVSDTVAPPVAVAFADQTIGSTESVQLIGRYSNDPNSVLQVAHVWEVLSGPAGSFFDDNTMADPTFTPAGVGVYEIELMVTDAEMLSDSTTIKIYVVDIDDGDSMTKDETFPTANVVVTHVDNEVAPNQNEQVNVNETVTMDASNTFDADGDTVNFLWKQLAGPMVSLADPSASIQTFTPTAAGTYRFWVDTTDAGDKGLGKAVNVQVSPVGVAPFGVTGTIVAADVTTAPYRVAIFDNGNGLGVNGDNNNAMINLNAAGSNITRYLWTQTAGNTVALTGIESANAGFWPVDHMGNLLTGSYIFRVDVWNAAGDTAWTRVRVVVESFDSINNPGGSSVPSVVAGDSMGNPNIVTTTNRGTQLFGSDSSDADGDLFSLTWSQTGGPSTILDFSMDPNNPTFTGVLPGTYTFDVYAVDDDGNISVAETVSIVVNRPIPASGGSSCAVSATTGGFGGIALLILAALATFVVRRRREEEAAV